MVFRVSGDSREDVKVVGQSQNVGLLTIRNKYRAENLRKSLFLGALCKRRVFEAKPLAVVGFRGSIFGSPETRGKVQK